MATSKSRLLVASITRSSRVPHARAARLAALRDQLQPARRLYTTARSVDVVHEGPAAAVPRVRAGWSLGVTIGKFYPYHRGHDRLIQRAKAQCERLVVFVGDRPGDAIPAELRARWIRQLHPEVTVLVVTDDLPMESKPWAARTLDFLTAAGMGKPDVAFTCEDYGTEYSAMMNCEHCKIEHMLRNVCCGTLLRRDLAQHWNMLTAPAKAYFCRRVVVVGVESSGTTTLAQQLAQHYQTAVVPEYGRTYWEGRQWTPRAAAEGSWDTGEFVAIQKGQAALENSLALRANRVLVCDTDCLATCVWHRRYVGDFAASVEAMADAHNAEPGTEELVPGVTGAGPPALTILTAPDFAFVQDGTRETEADVALRADMHNWFEELLERKRPGAWVVARGGQADRMAQVTAAIDKTLRWPMLPMAECWHPNGEGVGGHWAFE